MSLKFTFRELKIAAGKRIRVDEVASFFMLVSNTGDEKVKISIDDSGLSDCPVGYDYTERKDDEYFKHIDFMNPNAAEVTVEYIMSTGLVRSSPTILSLEGILAELRGDSTPENVGEEITVGAAQVQLLAANASRKGGSVCSDILNTGNIYLGFDNTVTTSAGGNIWFHVLTPGGSFQIDNYRGPIHAIATLAGQAVGVGEW